MAIERGDLVAVDGFDVAALRRVALGASLEDALAALLLDDAPAVAVTDGDAVLGVLTPDALHTAARRVSDG
jgi:hypothetical protein